MRALLKKEIQENLRWFLLAFLFTCCMAGVVISQATDGSRNNQVTQLVATNMLFAASAVATALGFLQFVLDQRNGPRAYLLHRGISNKQVYWSKLIVGIGFYGIATLIPLAIIATWLEAKGPMELATRGLQTIPALSGIFAAFACYPTAILIACRPARWFGSRPLPAILTGALLFACGIGLPHCTETATVLIITGIAFAVVTLLLIAAQYVYTVQASVPAAASEASRHLSFSTTILASCILGCMSLFLFIMGIVGFTQPRYDPDSGQRILVDDQGIPWYTTFRWEWDEHHGRVQTTVGGSPMLETATPDPNAKLKDKISLSSMVGMTAIGSGMYSSRADYCFGDFAHGMTPYWPTYDRRGYVLLYEFTGSRPESLMYVVSADGVHLPREPWGKPFNSASGVQTTIYLSADGGQLANHLWFVPIFCDRDGIYQVSLKERTVRKILDMPLEGVTGLYQMQQHRLRLFATSKQQMHVFDLVDSAGETNWMHDESLPDPSIMIRKLPDELRLVEVESFSIPSSLRAVDGLSLQYIEKGHWTLLGNLYQAPNMHLVARSGPGVEGVTEYVVRIPRPDLERLGEGLIVCAALPPVGLLSGTAMSYFYRQQSFPCTLAESLNLRSSTLYLYSFTGLLQSLVAGGLAMAVARHRRLGRGRQGLWTVIGMLTGWAASLAILAIYPRVIYEVCSRCNKKRRVDIVKCDHCGSAWEPQASQGIEIFFDTRVPMRAATAPAHTD